MTAAEIITQVRKHGGDVVLLPDGQRLEIEQRSRIPDPLVAEAKRRAYDLRALLVRQPASRATNATLDALETQRLLRQGRWLTTTPEECGFHIGVPGEACLRCGASWLAHFTFSPRKEAEIQEKVRVCNRLPV